MPRSGRNEGGSKLETVFISKIQPALISSLNGS